MSRPLGACFCLVLVMGYLPALSQNSVGVGTENPNENAVLELVSPNNDQGLLIPKLTTAQRTDPTFLARLTSTENGLLVFDSDENQFYYWQNSQWQQIINGGGDADADPQNEIQDLQLAGSTLTITNNGSATPIDLSGLAGVDSQTLTAVKTGSNVDISISNGNTVLVNVDDSDSDPTNEIQVAGGVPVAPAGNLVSTDVQSSLEELQGEIDLDLDQDPSNEIQNLIMTGNTVSIDGGGTGFDLSLVAPSPGEVLKWNGTNWESAIDATAAGSTLPILGDAQIVTNNGANTAVSISGDLNMDNTGNMTIQPNSISTNEIQDGTITDLDIDGAAIISSSKLQTNVMLEGENVSLLNNDAGYLTSVAASSVSVTPVGNLSSLNVQSGLEELQIDIDGDLDTDPSNELISSGILNVTNLEIDDAGGSTIIDLSPLIDDADADPVNEIQDLSLGGNTLSLSGDVTPVDLTAYLDNTDNQDIANVLGVGTNAAGADLLNIGSLTTSAFRLGVANPLGYVLTADISGNGTWQALPSFTTTDVIPKGSLSGLTASNLYDDGSNLGIGTLSPLANLHVNGNEGALFGGNFGLGTIPTEIGGTRMMWYPGKAAFRVGNDASGTNWTNANTGDYSVAMGQNTIASGNWSVSVGASNVASGDYSFTSGLLNNSLGITSVAMGRFNNADLEASVALGYANTANGLRSNAIGNSNTATNSNSTSIGYINNSTGIGSMALGYLTEATGDQSFTLGKNINATNAFSMVIGVGINNAFEITNNISNSLMIGYNSNVPTFFVGPSAGAGTTGNVGIGNSAPSSKLDVSGTITTTGFTMTTAPTIGYVLTSDGAGSGSWQPVPGPSGAAGGDLTGTYPNPTITTDAVGSSEITNNSIVNADINGTAAISGTKIDPDFGSQNVVTTGDVQVDVGSEFRYSSAKSRVMSISNKSFRTGNTAIYPLETNNGNTYTWVGGTSPGSNGVIFAPVYFPDGALLNNLEATIWDGDASFDLTVTLIALDLTTGGAGAVSGLGATSSGNLGAYETISRFLNNQPVTNSTHAYHIAFQGRQDNQELRIVGVKITYTVEVVD